MDLTSLLNTHAAGAAMRGESAGRGRRNSEIESSMEAVQTPSATTAGSTAPSSIAATPPQEQMSPQRLSESRTGSRNRTPWDAGGFSLSRALDAKQLMRCSPGAVALSAASISLLGDMSSSPQDTMDLGDSSPKSVSPRHKFSDSRSSLSSSHTISSSTNSFSHSRLSSLSTVSETQPLTALITDFSQLETQVSGSSAACYAIPYNQQYSTFTRMSEKNEDYRPNSPTPVRSRRNQTYEGSPERGPTSSPDRAQSPSDAILIPRLANGSSHSSLMGNTRYVLRGAFVRRLECGFCFAQNVVIPSLASPSASYHHLTAFEIKVNIQTEVGSSVLLTHYLCLIVRPFYLPILYIGALSTSAASYPEGFSRLLTFTPSCS